MMKNIIKTIMLVSLVVISACRKSDNATLPDGIVYLNQPLITKTSGDPAILDSDPLSFTAKINIDLQFKNSSKPDYLDLVVIKNGDAANAKVLKANINTYPTLIDVSGEQLSDLFGTIVSGDNFDFGVNYIVGGKTYEAFPEGGGASYGSGVLSQAGASPTVRYSAICAFNADNFVGDGRFEVTADGWGDYGVGSEVLVTKVNASTIAIAPALPAFTATVLKVNLGDNTLVVDKQALGDPGASYYGGANYGVLFIESSGGGTANYVNPCNGTIRISGSYTVSVGGFGSYPLGLKKIR